MDSLAIATPKVHQHQQLLKDLRKKLANQKRSEATAAQRRAELEAEIAAKLAEDPAPLNNTQADTPAPGAAPASPSDAASPPAPVERGARIPKVNLKPISEESDFKAVSGEEVAAPTSEGSAAAAAALTPGGQALPSLPRDPPPPPPPKGEPAAASEPGPVARSDSGTWTSERGLVTNVNVRSPEETTRPVLRYSALDDDIGRQCSKQPTYHDQKRFAGEELLKNFLPAQGQAIKQYVSTVVKLDVGRHWQEVEQQRDSERRQEQRDSEREQGHREQPRHPKASPPPRRDDRRSRVSC